MSESEHYRTLGVRPGASQEEIMHAYRLLAKTYHPDSSSGNGNASAFIRIVNAYQSLVRQRSTAFAAVGAAGASGCAPGSYQGAQRPRTAEKGTDVFSLGRTLLFDPEPGERARAARDLGWTGKVSGYAFLRKAFLDRDERVRTAAVRATGALRIQNSAADLGALFSRSGPLLKREILAAVGKIGSGNGFSGIVSLGLRDGDPSIRAAARITADART
jgi:HEAT repeat protein